MTTDQNVRLFVENRAEELIISGIFADLVRDNRLHVRMCWTVSSAISLAESSLLSKPDIPVALALNCTADPHEFRTPIERILSRAASEERWHVAVAVPDLTVWLRKDPRLEESIQKSLSDGRQPSKVDLAVHFKEWAQQSANCFDREHVSQRDREFADLNRFIEKHALAPTGTPE